MGKRNKRKGEYFINFIPIVYGYNFYQERDTLIGKKREFVVSCFLSGQTIILHYGLIALLNLFCCVYRATQ